LIDDGDVHSALKHLVKLKRDQWADASRSERYRMLVGIASAKIRLGNQEEAGDLLLDAYNECPEHKNALKNRATGYLLTKNSNEAKKLAQKLLIDDPCDAYIASIFIQSHIDDCTCDDPLINIPVDLNETEEVLIAYANFLRSRGNSDWVRVAKMASEKHPGNRLLKLFSAEAVLDDLIRKDQDAIAGGTFSKISSDQFHDAVEDLYSEARHALDKGCEFLPSTAHNSALALRLCNDILRAKEILDASIKQYPEDQNLRLQRALISYSENSPNEALNILQNMSTNPEALGLIAWALTATGKEDEALSLISEIDESILPKHVKSTLLDIRVRIYVHRDERQLAVDTISQRVAAEPADLALRALHIRTYRITGDTTGANEALEKALVLVNNQTSLLSRLELSFEAQKLKRNEVIVELLKGRVATDRENEGLLVLIAASINSSFWVTARETLNNVSPSLHEKQWFQRAEAILALNTGDTSADVKIARYLRQYPNDLEMILVQIGMWQKAGRVLDIRIFLQRLDLADKTGRPELLIRLAALMCHYEDSLRGLKYAYSILMDHWDNPQAHLAYQGLLFLNEGIGTAMPLPDSVAKDTVVGLLTEGGERRYRIEEGNHRFFEDERLSSDSDLGILLIGKKPGDKFKLQNNLTSRLVGVSWIKSVYLDAFHRSLEQFNERFPRTDGLQRFTVDPNAPDPIEDMRAFIKARAEADQRVLEEYRLKSIPLSFVAALLGKDPIDAWSGLRTVNIEFQVCRGLLLERDEALNVIRKNNKKGCVLDAITLSLVHRLGVEKAVVAVCGPIYTSQSVVDLFISRAIKAKQDVGRHQGFLGWRDEQLVFEKYTEEQKNNVAIEREKEASWARSVVTIAASMPKKDFSQETRKMIDMVGLEVCDPAAVANGNDLLLLSEDMGYRAWSALTFEIQTTWLQPVLICAQREGHLTIDEYCEAINLLALNGHTYISLDPICLIYQARKNNFRVTKDLSSLLARIGGASADLSSNSGVLSTFFDLLWQECSDEFKVKRIVSEAFNAFTQGRKEDLRHIIWLIWSRIKIKRLTLTEHTLGWLVGHSLGMPYFNELLQMRQE
jgi:tetratricopeptide (TPR) repeat protein